MLFFSFFDRRVIKKVVKRAVGLSSSNLLDIREKVKEFSKCICFRCSPPFPTKNWCRRKPAKLLYIFNKGLLCSTMIPLCSFSVFLTEEHKKGCQEGCRGFIIVKSSWYSWKGQGVLKMHLLHFAALPPFPTIFTIPSRNYYTYKNSILKRLNIFIQYAMQPLKCFSPMIHRQKGAVYHSIGLCSWFKQNFLLFWEKGGGIKIALLYVIIYCYTIWNANLETWISIVT